MATQKSSAVGTGLVRRSATRVAERAPGTGCLEQRPTPIVPHRGPVGTFASHPRTIVVASQAYGRRPFRLAKRQIARRAHDPRQLSNLIARVIHKLLGARLPRSTEAS